jgi:hypothetical protein
MGGSLVNLAIGITISQTVKSQRPREQRGTIGVREVDRWHTTSEFRGVNFRKYCIRIHDIAKFEVSMK